MSVVLALQASIMFVVAPLAATGHLSAAAVDAFRFGLAAAAVLMLTRSWPAALVIIVTFLASLLLSAVLRASGFPSAVYLVRITVTSVFDGAIAVVVARMAFGPGPVSVHRIMGA